MECTSISASMTHVFNPADWLSQFENFGGGYALTDRLALAILVEGRADDDVVAARRLINMLTAGDREALTAYLCGRA